MTSNSKAIPNMKNCACNLGVECLDRKLTNEIKNQCEVTWEEGGRRKQIAQCPYFLSGKCATKVESIPLLCRWCITEKSVIFKKK
jgi:hypothetical protein